jgi:cis-3-alkyl-4-acyloxetan-2-one decarboxylase
MKIRGFDYHYVDQGRGKPVVMVHGNPTWSFYYRALINALSPDFRTIAPDHIGCGLSETPDPSGYDFRLKSRIEDFDNFIAQLGFNEKITLVGHDWGGMIAMTHAVNHPESIERVVLFNTAAFPPPGGKKLPLRLRLIRDLALLSRPAVLKFNLFARAATVMATTKGLRQEVKAGLLAPYNSPKNRRATLEFVLDIPIHPGDPGFDILRHTADHLHRLNHLPFLICWGMRDFVFDKDYFKEWRRRFPHAQTHTFPDVGHYILEDAPQQIIPLVKDFLDADAKL